MSDITPVDAQIVDTLDVIQKNTLSGDVSKQSGAGKAFQSVSQSSAIAVQDATDNLRNVSTMATTAMGVAMAQMLATGDVKTYAGIIAAAEGMMIASTDHFAKVGTDAGTLVDNFPSGN